MIILKNYINNLYYLGSMINFIAVFCSPSISISVNAGTHIKSRPLGATNPLAIAIDFTAWFKAPAPIACISALPFSLSTPAKAPATELGLDFDETFYTSISISPMICL